MSKEKKRHYNRLFLDKLAYSGSYITPTIIHSWTFNANECHRTQLKANGSVPALADSGSRQWIQVCGLTTIESLVALTKRFKIDQGDLQDILTAYHVTKISGTDNSILLIVKDFYFDDKQELRVEHISLLLYENYVISFQESDRPIFELVGKALESNINKLRERPVDYLFGILLDTVINNNVEIIGHIEQSLEEMEEFLIDPQKNDENVGVRILTARKNIQHVKHSIIPLKEQLPRLIHSDDNRLIKKENLVYLIDINDHLQLAVQLLEACREEANAVFDLYIANNDLRMNNIMKRLTVVSTIFIPLTFITGVWGMNFQIMPETGWKYGYLFAWVVLFVAGVATWWYLRKRKWF